jgi:hypothetical protein
VPEIEIREKLYELNQKSVDTFGKADQNISDAYIVYQQVRIGAVHVEQQESHLQHLERIARETNDPYYHALAAITAYKVNNIEMA